MLIALGILAIASVFEVRHLIKAGEKKEAVIYLCIIAMTLALSTYLALTPLFYSFARMMETLFGVQ